MSFQAPVGKRSPQNPASSVSGPPNYNDPPVVGIETDYARSDHGHGLPAATGGSGTPSASVTGPDAFGDSAVVGVQNTFSRGDHNHGLPALPFIPAASVTVSGPASFGSGTVVGVATAYSRGDHSHGLPTAPAGTTASTTVTGPDSFGSSPVVGVSANYSRGDHDHGLPNLPASGTPATTVQTDNFGDPSAVGVLTSYAREDHDHGLPAIVSLISTPAAGVMYGPGIGADTLANTNLTTGSIASSYRFRAGASSTLVSARWYRLAAVPDPGYALGTGGTYSVEVYADDGTANHFPLGYPGSPLATQAFAASNTDLGGWLSTFAAPATLVSGTLYHLVIRNTDASPAANYQSVDNWFQYVTGGLVSPQIVPRFPFTDWAHLFFNGTTWISRTGYVPILGLTYGSGFTQGQSYGEASYAAGQVGKVVGANNLVREQFVPAATQIVTNLFIRLGRQTGGGSDPLIVKLKDGASNVLFNISIPSSSVAPVAVPSGSGDAAGTGSGQKWVNIGIPTTTLVSGTQYYLEFSAPGGGTTIYWMWVNRRLTFGLGVNNYPASTAFQDGDAEVTTNGGGTWTKLGNTGGNKQDIQFGFTTAATGGASGLALGPVTIFVVTGTPLGVVVAPVGSLALRTDGGANTTLYVKESATDATGWVGK